MKVWCSVLLISFVMLGCSFAETITPEQQRKNYEENLKQWVEHQRLLELEKAKLQVVLAQERLVAKEKKEDIQVNIEINNDNSATSSAFIKQKNVNNKK